jgi:hypothetical protein
MDLFAGAVNRENASSVLWVCDRCFKYMTDGTSWEVHMVGSGFPLAQATEGRHVDILPRPGRMVTEEVYAQASTG